MANVIVGIPSGYVISRDTVEWLYKANFTGLQRVRFYMQKLIMFFSHVSYILYMYTSLSRLTRVSSATHFAIAYKLLISVTFICACGQYW